MQQCGETRDAIIEDDNKRLADIVDANKNRSDPYWIVLFAKPSRNTVNGLPALAKHIKAYATKPRSQVGMCIGEVNNATGTISWEVNMPQRPFDYDALPGQKKEEFVIETTTIPNSYLVQ